MHRALERIRTHTRFLQWLWFLFRYLLRRGSARAIKLQLSLCTMWQFVRSNEEIQVQNRLWLCMALIFFSSVPYICLCFTWAVSRFGMCIILMTCTTWIRDTLLHMLTNGAHFCRYLNVCGVRRDFFFTRSLHREPFKRKTTVCLRNEGRMNE